MRDLLLTTTVVAELARQQKVTVYQWFGTRECKPWLPPSAGIGESRLFTLEKAVWLMVLSDFNRWGIPVPFAGRLVGRIVETLATEPNADQLTIEFRANGASFFYTEEVPEAAHAAGEVRFRLTLDLAAYRRAVAAAIASQPRVIGTDE